MITQQDERKKDYISPVLMEWGSITEITQGGAGGTQDDLTSGTET